MSDKSRYPWLVAICVSVIFLVVLYGSFQLLKKEKAKNLILQEQINDITAKQKITELKLEESKKKVTDLEIVAKDAQLQVDALNSTLEQEKRSRLEALEEIQTLKNSLEEQKQLRSRIEEGMKNAQSEVEKLQQQIKEFDSKKSELENKISELESKSKDVSLGTIVVGSDNKSISPAPAVTSVKGGVPGKGTEDKKASADKTAAVEATPAATASLPSGKLLVVNKDYNFVVINLGSKDGVGAGQVFSVYRDDKNLGEIKVEKIHETMSAAGFVTPELKDKVREGDKIVPKSK